MVYDMEGQTARRNRWFQLTREHITKWVGKDGEGLIPQFRSPYREPVWILPALYAGDPEHIELANKMVAAYHRSDERATRDTGTRSGKMYNVFQTNVFAELYYLHRHVLSPEADEVMRWHAEQALRTYAGSAQPDFVFRGCNDNMPALSTCGLVMAGQALGNQAAIEHARWNLRQLRQLLARNSWMSEYNSTTYSAVTLTAIAAIAEWATDSEIRDLANRCEERIWAEVLLHYHPATLHHAGPMSRSYSVDLAGHNHAVQALMWLAFGEEATGRDVAASYFSPDGKEVVHFEGCYAQSIAEYTHMLSRTLHVPNTLAHLASERRYPATLRGRAELNHSVESGAVIRTETYMTETFSLGTCSQPTCGGEQTASLFATYKRKPVLRDWRDAATVFVRYLTDKSQFGAKDTSIDGRFSGDRYISNRAWCYTAQKENVALLLTVPNLRSAPIVSESLKLSVVFPAHYGSIDAAIIGDGPRLNAACGESAEVASVSVQAGEVFIHVQPLLPTNLPRTAAVRLSRQNEYEVLDFINYEGEPLLLDRLHLSRVLNGIVLTVDDKSKYASLEAFHRIKSNARISDVLFVGMRYVEFLRDDVWFRVAVSNDTLGAMTEMIDGVPRPAPAFESNQIDASLLPFLGETSSPNVAFFPWDEMEIMEWSSSWIIGSRGLPGERPYSDPAEFMLEEPDGPKRSLLPAAAAVEDNRRRLAQFLATQEAR